jgi:hypothetical protein
MLDGPPENLRGHAGKVWPQSLLTKQRDFATFHTESKLVGDPWIERYLEFLDREIKVLAGPIGRHYFRCACAAYAEFITSGSRASRYRSWLCIKTACNWLAQLEHK